MNTRPTPPPARLARLLRRAHLLHRPRLPRRTRNPRRLLVLGHGRVGQRLARLAGPGWRVTGVARSDDGLSLARRDGVLAVRAPDAASPAGRARMRALARTATAVVIAFPPKPPAGHHARSDRDLHGWLAALGAATGARDRRPAWPIRVVYLSTTGVYGDRQAGTVDETSAPRPGTARAVARLNAEAAVRALLVSSARRQRRIAAGAGRSRTVGRPVPGAGTARSRTIGRLHRGARTGAWTTTRTAPIVAVRLRLPGLYDDETLPLDRIRARIAVPDDDPPVNRIHSDDVARAAWLAIARAPSGRLYNVIDDDRDSIGGWYDRLARWLGADPPPREDRATLLRRLGPVRASFLAETRRVDGRRLRAELGFRPRWPTLDDVLRVLPAPQPVPVGTPAPAVTTHPPAHSTPAVRSPQTD